MLQLVDVGPRSIASYRGIAPESLLHELATCAADLRGARVLHVNATPHCGGVSELLRSAIPLLNDLGIVAGWRIIVGGERFFTATKKIHNGLQGAAVGLTDLDRDTYIGTARRARDLGARGRERVRHHFLIPRLILNELQLMRDLAGTWAPAPSAVRFAGRDPVCGMAVAANEATPTAEVRGVTYSFCSNTCQRRFLRKPGLYLGSA